MFFDSFSAALHMGGHGGFVWSAYLITLLVVIILLVAPWRRERALL
ncbi:MAG: heme exporter protein CcmD, partial [Halieaceae bacterium]|nr:heme exporter protein CcmD [Halieaceae bacterium]